LGNGASSIRSTGAAQETLMVSISHMQSSRKSISLFVCCPTRLHSKRQHLTS
jgi:hypothetical protein